jgi:signal transduction histidine kinase
VSRLPIRVRLTAAFAAAMVVVLVAAGLFVYVRLRGNLDETVDEGLRARAAAVAEQAGGPGPPATAAGSDLTEADEGFAQVVTVDGRLGAASGGARSVVLSLAELRRAAGGELVVDRRVEGVEGDARVLARPVSESPGADVVAVGQSLEERDEALAGVVTSFSVGGPLAVVLASLIGYGLATAGLAPIEAMRRRAAEVSLVDPGEPLPLPEARDEVRRLGETLNAMLVRLRRSFEREQRFVADASHELRTPIAVVKTELEGALRGGDYGPGVRDALVAAIDECDQLGQLAEDLLVVARAAEGRLPIHATSLDVRDLLNAQAHRFGERAASHGRRIRVEAPEGVEVHGDELRLRQALGNLIDNALRHGEGEILLGGRRGADGTVVLEVSDEGAGLTGDFVERAFERFARGDAARTRGGGAGLGLSIVRTLAETHGGDATLVPGAAATVRISLPAASQVGLSRPTYGGATPHPTQGETR